MEAGWQNQIQPEAAKDKGKGRTFMRNVPWKLVIPVAIVCLIVLLLLLFQVRSITVEGNTLFSEETVAAEVCGTILDKNTISSFLKNRLGFRAELPYVREYEITYPGIHEIHIKLHEKKMIAGIAYMNQYIYFDSDGTVLRSTNEELPDIPLFETKTMTTFTLYEKVQMQDEDLLGQILNLSNLFQHYGVKWDKVVFDTKNAAFLYAGDIKVSLGKKQSYDEQISALSSVLATAREQGLAGEIDLTNYHVKGDIIFKKSR